MNTKSVLIRTIVHKVIAVILSNQSVCSRILNMTRSLEDASVLKIPSKSGIRSLIGTILARRRRDFLGVWAGKGLIPYPPRGGWGGSEN